MHPPLDNSTKKFWEAVHDFRRKGYGHWVQTTLAVRPELVPKEYHFCRVPSIDHSLAVWGFRDAEKSAKFITSYGGEKWLSATR
jgi:hypothetical protein